MLYNLNELIKLRGNNLEWYVLRYDIKTTKYNNEIVFKTYKQALNSFNKMKPKYKNERVELIFSPNEDDNEFYENEVIIFKDYEGEYK